MIKNSGRGFVLGKTTETASSNSEYCIEKMRVMMSLPRDNKLEMAVFVTQVELVKSIRCQETSCPTDMGKTYPVGNFFDEIPKKAGFSGIFQGKPALKSLVFLR